MNREVLRLIDANLNRVTEGLRVVEDVFRYVRNDAPMQQRLKRMRHRISAQADPAPLVSSRDAAGDVGFAAKGSLENRRSSIRDVIRSNMKRAQEGLRVLEELMKIDSPDRAALMKELRYECYQLERDMERAYRPVLGPGLYLILTQPRAGYEALARMAVAEKIPAIQLRCKNESSEAFLMTARALRDITAGTDTLLIINDRVDIAMISGADGIHLGQDDIPPREARELAGEKMLIGLSTHNLEQVERAQDEPVDYIGFGPVFPPFSKTDPDPVTGVEALGRAVALSGLPVAAIGGITRARLEDLAGIPCHNVACIHAVANAPDPAQEMRAIHARTGVRS
ncbi:MAG: thiamine phosphate synthase [Desulfomonilia bacterium]|jgi:thiamine-phosphate pyrophosphorylase|uniref:thiamine phosphate synthase n=1 Tax=anaerobic digester metagenome TaxID=1263854 RepID=A0A485M8Q9_9ZZZZ|nr:thiamine phosphate synthase [Pseudomonadota bacterium]HON39561.1 thiamine phosphate synthase [Deltaproteobacteria bacterium]HRS56539.1 thiamine phosphate synthase [Desulfomonilia bacterium]HPD21636.1 thiamine phosphate synthase [Deltaproteobacteria bacterium]HPX19026.1 thiamine phosphate synthase [Deltaproteobacteria bacterium]